MWDFTCEIMVLEHFTCNESSHQVSHVDFYMWSHILSHVKPGGFGTLHMRWYLTCRFTFEAFSHLKIKFAVPHVRQIPTWKTTSHKFNCIFTREKRSRVKIEVAVLHLLSHLFHMCSFVVGMIIMQGCCEVLIPLSPGTGLLLPVSMFSTRVLSLAR